MFDTEQFKPVVIVVVPDEERRHQIDSMLVSEGVKPIRCPVSMVPELLGWIASGEITVDVKGIVESDREGEGVEEIISRASRLYKGLPVIHCSEKLPTTDGLEDALVLAKVRFARFDDSLSFTGEDQVTAVRHELVFAS